MEDIVGVKEPARSRAKKVSHTSTLRTGIRSAGLNRWAGRTGAGRARTGSGRAGLVDHSIRYMGMATIFR